MSVTPPSGYGVWVATLTLTGSTKLFQITMGYRIISLDNAAQSNFKIRAAATGTGRPLNGLQMATGYTLISSYVLQNLSGLLTTDILTTTVAGSKSLSPTTQNTSLVIRKNTALAGRQYRGRFLVPPMNLAEGDVSAAGQITGTSLSSNASNWSAFHGDLNGSAAPQVVLLHGPDNLGVTPVPTLVASFSVAPTIGTIRRRIRP